MSEDTGLEQELERMLEIETFEPPAEFRERADWTDPAIYDEAAADPVGWWTARSKELLDWDVEPTVGLERLEPALLQVVRGRADQRLGPVPRPPRRRRQRRAGRLPLARRGGGAPRRHLRRAPRLDPALRQRPQGPRRGEGRRGRDLPADDPRGRRRDARLRADRRRPQRRLRRLLRRVGPRADGIRRGQGAGHRRRGAPQGQDRADQGAGRRASSATWRRWRRSSSSAPPGSSAR